jgi:hypothetical protein
VLNVKQKSLKWIRERLRANRFNFHTKDFTILLTITAVINKDFYTAAIQNGPKLSLRNSLQIKCVIHKVEIRA